MQAAVNNHSVALRNQPTFQKEWVSHFIAQKKNQTPHFPTWHLLQTLLITVLFSYQAKQSHLCEAGWDLPICSTGSSGVCGSSNWYRPVTLWKELCAQQLQVPRVQTQFLLPSFLHVFIRGMLSVCFPSEPHHQSSVLVLQALTNHPFCLESTH